MLQLTNVMLLLYQCPMWFKETKENFEIIYKFGVCCEDLILNLFTSHSQFLKPICNKINKTHNIVIR